MRQFLAKHTRLAWLLAFAGVYALAMGYIFWGVWSPDRAPVAPDCALTFAENDVAAWLKALWGGKDFVPTDLMHVLGGMWLWQELQFAVPSFLAALGVAFYLRGRKASELASYTAGAAFGLAGYCFTLFSAGHLGWFVWLAYGPFAFGLIDRAVRKGKWRNWILLGAVLAWASARQPDLWLMFTLLSFAYGLWCVWRERRSLFPKGWKRMAAGLVVCGAVALAVGTPQFCHALFVEVAGREKQIAESTGAKAKTDDPAAQKAAREERWLFCTSWSLPPEDILEFAVAEVHGGSCDPRVNSRQGNRPYVGRLGQHGVVPAGSRGGRHPVTGQQLKAGDEYWMPYRQHSLYFGIVTLLFALCALPTLVRRRRDTSSPQDDGESALFADVPFWCGAGLLALVLALGAFTPFYRIVFALPFGDQIRCPVKLVHLVEFAVAVLAGYGVEWLRRRFGEGRSWLVVVLAALAVVNVVDLARVDERYLAVQDFSFQRAPNDAAIDVVKLGGGKVQVTLAPQEGGMMLRDSLGIHLVESSDSSVGARFVLAGGASFSKDAALRERIASGQLRGVGTYSLTREGVRRVPQAQASLLLLQDPAVPAPAPAEEPVSRGKQALGFLSIFSTLAVAFVGLSKLKGKK